MIRFTFYELGKNEHRIMDAQGTGFMFIKGLMNMTDDEVFAAMVELADRNGYTPAKQVARKMTEDWYAQ